MRSHQGDKNCRNRCSARFRICNALVRNDDELAPQVVVVPNLARGIVLSGLDQLWVAGGVRLSRGHPRLLQPLGSRLGAGSASAGGLAISALMMTITARQPTLPIGQALLEWQNCDRFDDVCSHPFEGRQGPCGMLLAARRCRSLGAHCFCSVCGSLR
jgi:hypothetical protein